MTDKKDNPNADLPPINPDEPFVLAFYQTAKRRIVEVFTGKEAEEAALAWADDKALTTKSEVFVMSPSTISSPPPEKAVRRAVGGKGSPPPKK